MGDQGRIRKPIESDSRLISPRKPSCQRRTIQFLKPPEKSKEVKIEPPPKKPAQPTKKPAEPTIKKPANPVVSKPPIKPVDPKPSAGQDPRRMLPDDMAVVDAVKALRKEHQDEYNGLQTNTALQTLAVTLLKEGGQTKNDPVNALLYTEAHLWQAAPPIRARLKVAESLVRDYPINLLDANVAALQEVGKSLNNPTPAHAFLVPRCPC